MLRQTRPIVVCGQSVAFSLASSQRQLPTRWGPIHPARPHETRSHSFEMSAKYSASKIKGTEHDGTHVSGRHPTDESYKSFIDKLGQLAGSSLAGNPKCISCDRLTESPGRVFLLTMDDRRQLIAKIPNPISGLAFYTTASEVATMKFCTSCCLYVLFSYMFNCTANMGASLSSAFVHKSSCSGSLCLEPRINK